MTSSQPLFARTSNVISAPVLKWQNGGCHTTWCRTGWYASPAVADLDNDNKPEVVWTDYRIVAVNGEDGSDQWVVDHPGGGRGWSSVVVADVDDNGQAEVIVTTWTGKGSNAAGQLPVLSSMGNLIHEVDLPRLLD